MQAFSSVVAVFKGRSAARLLLATFLLVSVALVVSTPATSHAKAHSTSIQLSTIAMINARHGWAFARDRKHLLITALGPEHWTDVTPPLVVNNISTITVTASFFLDATHGYLGVELQNGNVFLLSTQDGGKTWQSTQFSIPILTDPVTITQITFLDVQHGWLSFDRAQVEPGVFDILLMSTGDGGKTWHTLFDTSQNPSVLPPPFSLSSHFLFLTPQDGWVTGILPADDVYLYETHDGGKTWKRANIAPMKGGESVDFTQDYGPYWQNSKAATLYVKYDPFTGNGMPHITTYQTHDGGASWILEPSSPSTSFQEFSLLSFLNAQQGWSFGFDGAGQFILHHTSNGGQFWSLLQPRGLPQADINNQVLLQLSFITSTTGWVLINGKQNIIHLFQTSTGGHDWYELHPVVG